MQRPRHDDGGAEMNGFAENAVFAAVWQDRDAQRRICQNFQLRAKGQKQGFDRKTSLQTKRTSAIIAPVFGTETFSLRFAGFSTLMRLAKKDDDCRITFVFCLTELTFVAYHEFYA